MFRKKKNKVLSHKESIPHWQKCNKHCYFNSITKIKRDELIHYSQLRKKYKQSLLVKGANESDISVDVAFCKKRQMFDYYIYSDGMLVQRSIPNTDYNRLIINNKFSFDTSGTKHINPSQDGFLGEELDVM